MSGIDSDVAGIFPAMASMKTEKASRTVTPRAIFSPESGGRQNTSTVNVDIIMHGKTMLYLSTETFFSFCQYSIARKQNSLLVVSSFLT